MPEKISAEMRFSFLDEKKAQTVLKTMEPEFSGKHEKRAQTKASIEKNILSISVAAEDLGSMKASMQSYSKAIALINGLINGGLD